MKIKKKNQCSDAFESISFVGSTASRKQRLSGLTQELMILCLGFNLDEMIWYYLPVLKSRETFSPIQGRMQRKDNSWEKRNPNNEKTETIAPRKKQIRILFNKTASLNAFVGQQFWLDQSWNEKAWHSGVSWLKANLGLYIGIAMLVHSSSSPEYLSQLIVLGCPERVGKK